MNFLQKKLWLAWQKFRFLRLPIETRVRLEVEQDGRHLTFLLVSLYEAGYGVQVVNSPWVFRELICLGKSAPIPFVIGGKERECGISITDREPSTLDSGRSSLIVFDYDYFSGLTTKRQESEVEELTTESTENTEVATALRAPYFMHPSVYHRGLHKKRSSDTDLDTRHSPPVTRHSAEGASASHPLRATSYSPPRHRRFRIGFFGTHDREFYTKHYHFPGMSRFEILEVSLQKFGDRITHLRGFPKDWEVCEIAVSIDARGGDRSGKTFLSQDHYFEALRECDFVLSPPGWCMPVSHNLIEAMFCGAIPITNAGAFMAEPLKDGKTCLEFQDAEGLVPVIERALAMDAGEVELMRGAVLEYYNRFLKPKAFAEELRRSDYRRVFVNAEEKSIVQECSRVCVMKGGAVECDSF